MNIGLLNERITFQKAESSLNEMGGTRTTWNDYYTCFATISGETGNENTVEGLEIEQSDISFTVRYCKRAAEINASEFRVIFHGEEYGIIGVDHMNYKKEAIKFRCQTVRS